MANYCLLDFKRSFSEQGRKHSISFCPINCFRCRHPLPMDDFSLFELEQWMTVGDSDSTETSAISLPPQSTPSTTVPEYPVDEERYNSGYLTAFCVIS